MGIIVLDLHVLGSIIIVTGAALVIISQVYKKEKKIWETKSIIETSEKINGVPVRVIILPSYPALTFLSGKFKELNGKQILLRINPYLQIHGLQKALTPTWYREILSEGDFSLEIPPFTPCEIDIESIDKDLRKLYFECSRIEITKPLEKLFEIGLTVVTIGVIIFFS
ncbi:MAG: hypothetical protein QXH96_01295 [Candidatus Geothermarchaeota archaeon]